MLQVSRSSGTCLNRVQGSPLAVHPRDVPRAIGGLGKLKEIEVKLHIDQSIPPVAQKLRPILFNICELVTEEIWRLEELDVIEKASHPTT